ncbi:multiheme c-type cytochrome [candidate division KSB1 bacterium]
MKGFRILSILLTVLFLFSAFAVAQDKPHYVGANKCKACHQSAKKGAQFKIWQEKRHSKAFETLGTPRAKEVAAGAGVSGNPQDSKECLQCHVTAYSVEASLKDASYAQEEGVGCETCHGPGSLYKKASVMSAKKYAADPEGSVKSWMTMGLTKPDESLCKTCHNEKSPTYKPFDYKKFSEMIAHPNPNIKK